MTDKPQHTAQPVTCEFNPLIEKLDSEGTTTNLSSELRLARDLAGFKAERLIGGTKGDADEHLKNAAQTLAGMSDGERQAYATHLTCGMHGEWKADKDSHGKIVAVTHKAEGARKSDMTIDFKDGNATVTTMNTLDFVRIGTDKRSQSAPIRKH